MSQKVEMTLNFQKDSLDVLFAKFNENTGNLIATARVKQRKYRTNYNEPRIQRKSKPQTMKTSKYSAQKFTVSLTRGTRIL
jgi:hypothetical protein